MKRPRRFACGWTALMFAVSVAVGSCIAVTAAAADSLGGISPSNLTAIEFASSSGAPVVVAYENFGGSTGTNLHNTTTDGGGFLWRANAGTWTIQGNQARSTSSPLGSLVFNGTSNNGSVEATISRNGSTAFDTFLIVNGTSTSSDFLLANWWNSANGTIELYKVQSGTPTSLGAVSGLYPGGLSTAPASVVVRIEAPSGGTVNVFLDGALRISYTLTAGEQTTFKNATHRYVGIGTSGDATSTFDNFHLDA